jgi:hypothetical protein
MDICLSFSNVVISVHNAIFLNKIGDPKFGWRREGVSYINAVKKGSRTLFQPAS